MVIALNFIVTVYSIVATVLLILALDKINRLENKGEIR